MDSYYGQLELMQDLANKHNLTVVATIQTGRKGVPEETKKRYDRDLHYALFSWSRGIMMMTVRICYDR